MGYKDWSSYNSDNATEWNRLQKHVTDYLHTHIDDRESVDVNGKVHDRMPTVQIAIQTFYKNKHFNRELTLPFNLLTILSFEETESLLDAFLQKFRSEFGIMSTPSLPAKHKKTTKPDQNSRFTGIDLTE